jgi:hypothetical protein
MTTVIVNTDMAAAYTHFIDDETDDDLPPATDNRAYTPIAARVTEMRKTLRHGRRGKLPQIEGAIESMITAWEKFSEMTAEVEVSN